MHDDHTEIPPDDWPTITGHVLSGLVTMHSEGVNRDDVFMRCDDLAHLQPDVLNRLNETAPTLR